MMKKNSALPVPARRLIPAFIIAAFSIGASTALAGGNDIYVDDDWAALNNGDMVVIDEFTNAEIGVDAFASIQDAIDAAIGSTSIFVFPGSYEGGIQISSDSISLLGVSEEDDLRGGTLTPVIQGDWVNGGPSYGIHVTPGTASTTINGFQITGFFTGVFTDPDSGLGGGMGTVSGLSINNCVFTANGLDGALTDPAAGGIANAIGVGMGQPQVAPGAISLASVDSVNIQNNDIFGDLNGNTPLAGGITLVGDASNVLIGSNFISDMVFGITVGAGHDTMLMGDTESIALAGNEVQNSALIGIYVIDGTTDNEFLNLVIDSNSVIGSGEAGIVCTVGGFTGGSDPDGSIDSLSISNNLVAFNGYNDVLTTRGGLYMNLRSGATGGITGFSFAGNIVASNFNASDYPFAAGLFFIDVANVAGDYLYQNVFAQNERGLMQFSSSPDLIVDTNAFVDNLEGIVLRSSSRISTITESLFWGNVHDVAVEGPLAITTTFSGNLLDDQSVVNDTVAFDSSRLVVANNWYGNVFGFDRDADDGMGGNGLIDGLNPTVSTQSNTDITEAGVVAQYDRDGDGIPDAFEGFGLLYQSLFGDFDNTFTYDPNLPDGFNGVTLNDDDDMDGVADWYQNTLPYVAITQTNIDLNAINLGDVTNDGLIEIGDAVRTLQILNSTLQPGDPNFDNANLNGMNVTGTKSYSLNNALQILRWSNGSRTLFPAIMGVD